MNILVTGGAGFIGSHVAEKLVNLGHKVVVVDNLNLYYSPKLKLQNIRTLLNKENFVFKYGDIVDKAFLNKLFAKYEIEAVIHLAARAGVRHSILKPLWYKETNITGTVNLLELAKQYQIKNFIFVSSSSVYGEKTEGPFKEEDDTSHPVSPYAASKKAGEIFCYTYSHLAGLPVTVLRLFNVYGPRMRPELAMPLFAEGIRSGQPIIQFGDGSMRRSYTYIDDIVSGILLALAKPAAYRVLNLGKQETIALRDLISTMEKIYGKQAKKIILPKPPGDVSLTFANSQRAKDELGWEAKVDFMSGCRRFINWYEKEGWLVKNKQQFYIKGLTKKILILSLNYSPYIAGIETSLKQITNKIDHHYYDLICARFDRRLPKTEKIGNVQVYRVGWGYPLDKFVYPWLATLKALQLNYKQNYHIIWAATDSYAGLAAAWVKLFKPKIKFLLSLFGGEIKGWLKMIWLFFSRLLYRSVDQLHITAPGQLKRALKAHYRGGFVLAPHGITNDVFQKVSQIELDEYKLKLGLKETDKILFSVLGFNYKDAYWELFSLIKKMEEEYKLLLAVDKKIYEEIAEKVKLFGLNKKVKIIKADENFNINLVFELAKAFVVLINKQTVPVYILEAMFKKVPLVVADYGVSIEWLIDRKSVLFYKAGQYQAGRELIRQAVENASLRKNLVERAYHQVASSYDWESVAEKIKHIFDKI